MKSLRLVACAFALSVAACGPGSIAGNGVVPNMGDDGGTDDAMVQAVYDFSGLDFAGGCGLRTCQSAHANCGPIGDGCGGVVQCGTCPTNQTCGGGGVPSQCGGMTCTPRTCASANANCGPLADGCGKLLQCGNCAAGQSCGIGGKPNVCAPIPMNGPPPCTPKTCSMLGFNCGPAGDTCGGMLDCGTCPMGQGCGVGGKAGVCGALSMCKPLTCAAQGFNCGKAGDGCGNVIDCGSCASPNICGGGGKPNVCGNSVVGQCVNLCQQQMNCGNGVTTTISGTVYAPTNAALGYGNPDPLYNALVYIPNGTIDSFQPGVSCNQCSAQASGSPLVSATSGPDGKFTLANAPCGTNIPLVIQIGRWRRKVTIPSITCCTNNGLTADETRLPRNKSEGDIPLIAVVTGGADPIECVLPKIGIDASEFTNPGGGGRVNLYWSDSSNIINPGDFSSAGAVIDINTPPGSSLWTSTSQLDQYDAVILDCEGLPYQGAKPPNVAQNFVSYTSAGGRLFASHYQWSWLDYQGSPFNGVASWDVTQSWTSPARNPMNGFPYDSTAFTALIDQSFPKGMAFATWLGIVGAASSPGQIPVYAVRHDFDAVIPPSQRWFYTATNASYYNYSNIPLEFTFNTPVGAQPANQCGRVAFSDFHVNTGGNQTPFFPSECGNPSPMTAQEKALEFMLFDLTSCIQPDMPPPPPTCSPLSCAQQHATCGEVGDGCGNVMSCGTCPAGQTCGGGGVPNQCGGSTCMPLSCAAQNLECGPAGDGCGNALDCGKCPAGQVCGAGGPGKCGGVDGGACMPLTCAQQNLSCGPAGDGCGGSLDCGTCPAGQTCGGGGVNGKCGATMCTPATCKTAGAQCGQIGDGCGNVIDCGPCPTGQTCGGGGMPNVCAAIG